MPKAPSPSRLVKTLRSAQRRFAASAAGTATGAMRARIAGPGALRRVLLVSDRVVFTSEQQFAPLIRFAPQIAQRFGIVFRFADLAEARAMSADTLRSFAAVGLKLNFRTSAADAEASAAAVFGPIRGTATRALVFDGDDDLGVLWPGVIAQCDAYIKKHIHADPASYGKATVGKTNLTDYVHHRYGTAFDGDIIPGVIGLPPGERQKIILGWNIALDDKIFDLARDLAAPGAQARSIDLLCRASVPQTIWTFPMRDAAVQAIRALSARFRVHAPTDRVSQEAYYGEMLNSRMSVSPFGFGELCWRDFESILCGALLVKPDMSHLRTAPDLFVPGETYLPVAWDFSDLEAVCAPFLADETLRRKIADQARATLLDALHADWFLDRFATTMAAAGR